MIQRKHVPLTLVLAYASEWAAEPLRTPGVLARLIHDGFPPKVALAKLHRMADQDYIEYGSSPAFAWPMKKGRAFLAAEEGAA
ncbi:hypothetical protein LCL61_28035 [Amycolatopsis coloradensis]|uniref:Uncharacterized protein n=1 Tax=Amycolatopsis coloradensis TaxID=76021 RepID=A0ACD5BJI0_9PSEU